MNAIRPNCFARQCKHFLGFVNPEGDEEDGEIVNCSAFPEGIPDEIAFGSDTHAEKHPDQDNDIVYERL